MALAMCLLFTLLRAQRAGLRLARRRAEELARRDPLTGLGNRLSLQEALEVEVARARRQGSPLTLIVGDLDDFEDTNDDFGHATGDNCLRKVGGRDQLRLAHRGPMLSLGRRRVRDRPPRHERRRGGGRAARVSAAASEACDVPDGRAVISTCGTAELEPARTGAREARRAMPRPTGGPTARAAGRRR
jgi:hypothetical protein